MKSDLKPNVLGDFLNMKICSSTGEVVFQPFPVFLTSTWQRRVSEKEFHMDSSFPLLEVQYILIKWQKYSPASQSCAFCSGCEIPQSEC